MPISLMCRLPTTPRLSRLSATHTHPLSTSRASPPARLDSTDIARFEASKEYRGYTMVPSYQLTCNAARNEVLSVQPVSGTSFAMSLGYTRLVVAYEPGESFSPQDSSFDAAAPAIVVDPDGAVTVSYRWASRIATTFIKQGGRYVNPPGYGNLAFPCHVMQFDNGDRNPVFSYDACSDNQLPAGAGTGGGGSL